MESAYGVANNLATYLSAFQSGNIGSADNSIDNSTIADLGILGTAGFAVGGFLRSPFATDEASDIQITVYPTVSEPHILSLEARLRTALSSGGGCSGSESAAADPLPAVGYDSSDVLDEARHSDQDKPGKPKGGSSSSDTHSGTKKPTDVSKCPDTADYLGRRSPSDMLVTVQLLYPDAEMQVRLNSLDPVDGDPVIVPVTSNRTSSAFLSERDKARLAWGVQSARKILAASQLKAVLNAEISPGVQTVDGDLLQWVRRRRHHFVYDCCICGHCVSYDLSVCYSFSGGDKCGGQLELCRLRWHGPLIGFGVLGVVGGGIQPWQVCC
jgi:hypothetical protein